MSSNKFSRRRILMIGLIPAVLIVALAGSVASGSKATAPNKTPAPAASCPAVQPLLLMPFHDTTSHKCTQGAGGGTSHNLNSTRHDLDLDDIGGGEEVVASAPGIAYLQNDGEGGFGRHINIKHNDTYFTIYGHLSAYRVQNGQFVERGQVIGLTGCTGTCYGEHLHWGLHTGNPQVSASSSTSVTAEKILTSDATANATTYRLYSSDEFVGGIPSGHFYRSNNKWCYGGYSEGYRTESCDQPVHSEGTLIRTRSDVNGTVYVLRRNDAHMSALHRDGIPTEQTLWTLYQNGGLGLQDVVVVEDAEMNSYPTGGTICQNGCTLQSPLQGNGRSEPPGRLISNGTEVSIVQSDGGRRPFSSQMTFSRMGYLYCNVKTVADYDSYLPVGQIVDGTPEDVGGAADEFGPNLSITSHTDGQAVTGSTVTISGTASDAGRGESGVASVTVNGVRASGDTAAVSDTAYWSRAVTLSPGANTITVVARDNSPTPNETSQAITLYLSGGGGGVMTLATGLSNPNNIATDGTEVFWTDYGSSSVRKVSANGGPVTTLASSMNSPSGIGVDNSYVYFGTDLGLRKVPKSGGSVVTLASGNVNRLVVAGTNVFWTNYNAGTVQKISVNGGTVTTLASGVPSPMGIALSGSNVCWSEFSNPGAVRCVGVNGGQVSVLANNSNAPGIAADAANVYWAENRFINGGKVNRAPASGGTPVSLATGLNSPWDVAIDGARAFWVENSTNGAVKQVSLGGGTPVVLAGGLAEPVALAVDSASVYWVERAGGGSGTGVLKKVAFSVQQPGCTSTLSSSENTVGPGNGGGSFLIDTTSGCSWSAVSDSPSWLTTSSSGSGDGRIDYNFAANNSTSSRIGRITVGGKTTTITQIGLGGAGSVQFSSSAYSVNENGSTITITVTRSGGTETGTVQYSTSNGTAIAGSDYASVSGLLLFTTNVTSRSFTIPILDDTVNEGTESINLTLNSPSLSFTLGSPSSATVTIADNDTLQAPTAHAGGPYAAQAGHSIQFDGSASADPDGIITSYSWDFGDGSAPSTGATPTHAYAAAGTYTVTLTVTDDDSATASASTTATISAAGTVGLQYYPLARPVRLLDTRPGETACFTPAAPLQANAVRTQAAVGTCAGLNIPATARAIVGNATVVSPPASGHITLYPSDASLPNASNLNYVAGQIIPNAFTVGLSAAGSFNIYTPTQTHFVVDIAGYYAPPGQGGLYYHPLPHPVRLLDTRIGQSACDAPGAPIQGGTSRTETARINCGGLALPSDAVAIVGNATVVNTQPGSVGGHVTLYPSGVALPNVSNLNYSPGQVVPNAFTLSLGSDGAFQIYAATTLDFIVDVTGYYSAGDVVDANGKSGLNFYALAAPVRLLDTRAGASACYTPGAPLPADSSRTQQARLTCAGATVPTSAQAILGNATVVAPASPGHIILYPSGAAQPVVSNLNYLQGQIIPNAFNVGLGADGAFKIYTPAQTHFIIDMSGYFALPPL